MSPRTRWCRPCETSRSVTGSHLFEREMCPHPTTHLAALPSHLWRRTSSTSSTRTPATDGCTPTFPSYLRFTRRARTWMRPERWSRTPSSLSWTSVGNAARRSRRPAGRWSSRSRSLREETAARAAPHGSRLPPRSRGRQAGTLGEPGDGATDDSASPPRDQDADRAWDLPPARRPSPTRRLIRTRRRKTVSPTVSRSQQF